MCVCACVRAARHVAAAITPCRRRVPPSRARADLLRFKNAAAVRHAHHITSYSLAIGVPAALLLGGPVATVFDFAAGVIIPLHFHIGMRSIIVDYVHPEGIQTACFALLAGFTVLTAIGITKFNLTDVGLTGAVKELFTKQEAPVEKQVVKKYTPKF